VLRRSALALLMSLALFVQAGTAFAHSHGAALKGQEIDLAGSMRGLAGECSCLDRWYTFGLKPGPVNVTVRFTSAVQTVAPSYGLKVTLMQGAHQLDFGQVGCPPSDSVCRQQVHLRYKVKKRGAYYVLVQGLGANDIPFAIQVTSAHLYPLHCRQYC
jgi:hypothetical protein